MFLPDLSIKRPIMMSMILLVFVIFGVLSFVDMKQELTPPMTMPIVTIQTIYGGAGPEELELQVTKKIEDEISSISGVDAIDSYSMESVSFIMIIFDMEKDVYIALMEVKDKVDAIANDFPDNADLPIIKLYDPTSIPVVDIIFSGSLPITELYELADKNLKNRFSQIAGVGNVQLTGGREREIRVELDSKTVLQNSVPLSQLAQILAVQNLDMPGGNFQKRSQEYSVRLDGEFTDVESIRKLEIPTAYGVKTLGELAVITDSGQDVRERTTYFNNIAKTGNDNVIQLSLVKTADGNAVEIYNAVMAALPEIRSTLPAGSSLDVINESASFVESSVKDTLVNILLGIVLTSLVLFFFLHDYRSTIIIALSMPMSIMSSFLLMKMAGFTLNIMSLMGLSTAVGILVANSVLVLENIFRHKSLGESKFNSASKGTSEIAVAVIASSLTNVAVFIPLGTMSSIVGSLFEQFSLTVVFATVFSIIMAFTLTPMLAAMILPEHDRKKSPVGNFLEGIFTSWENGYRKLLSFLLKTKTRGWAVLFVTVLLFIFGLRLGGNVGFEFIPSLDDGIIGINVELPVGYKLDETSRTMKNIEERVLLHKEVSHSWTQIGRLSEMDLGVNLAMMKVKLVGTSERTQSTDEFSSMLSRELSDITNAKIRIAPVPSIGSGESDIEFDLVGNDIEILKVIEQSLYKKIQDIPGVYNLNSSSRPGKPQVTVTPDRQKMTKAGITVYDMAMSLRGGVDGLVSTYYKDHGEEYDIRVTLDDTAVDSPEDIGNIPLFGRENSYRLEQMADITITEGYSQIKHVDRYKAIGFGCDVLPGYVMGDIMAEIDIVAAEENFPVGLELKYGGVSDEMGKTIKDIIRAFIIAVLLTYMLLAAMLESLIQPLLILSTIPLALIGVFSALTLTGLSLDIIAMLAMVMLVGIVVNNAILQIDYTNMLVRKQGKSTHDALLEACPTKLKPILMSNIAIILGMLPMAMGIGDAGAEMRQPMGVVAIGGLAASTVLSLIVIPVLFNIISKKTVSKG
jgi:hydrophobic/amphiphilic exporter-1 (mainly G- bacteria), HAE1 family